MAAPVQAAACRDLRSGYSFQAATDVHSDAAVAKKATNSAEQTNIMYVPPINKQQVSLMCKGQ